MRSRMAREREVNERPHPSLLRLPPPSSFSLFSIEKMTRGRKRRKKEMSKKKQTKPLRMYRTLLIPFSELYIYIYVKSFDMVV